MSKKTTNCLHRGEGVHLYDPIRESIHSLFDIERELKSSERGTVYLVRNKKTKVRNIYREYTGNSEVYKKLQGLECSHLPKIEAVAENADQVLVLEEYIQGDTLASLLSYGPLPASHVRDIAIQLCEALHTLHAIGIVHRDIKPENIILRGNEAVLIDFDASRQKKAEQTTDTQMMGTAGYAAPEQYGFAQTDARADIYALGVLINEMLVKQHPAKQLADGPYLPIISKCIEVNVDRRYSSAAELLNALKRTSATPKVKIDSVRKLIAGIIAACIVICGSLYALSRTATGQLQSPIVEDASPSPSFESTSPHPSPEVIFNRWEQQNLGYATEFQYDLDGDGITEEYLFGIAFQNHIPGQLLKDERLEINVGDTPIRCPFPCVWRCEPNGNLTVVEEFASILSQPEVTLYYLAGPANDEPSINSLDSVWGGGLKVVYTSMCEGVWAYEATATVNGTPISALATITIVLIGNEQQ